MATLTIIEFPDEPNDFDVKGDAGFVAAAVGGDSFRNGGNTGLYVENTSGGALTLTIVAAKLCNHGTLHDADIVVDNGFDGFVAMDLDNSRFSDSDGTVSLTYSAIGLNVGAVRRS